jgi:hypothetical protein
MLMNADRGGIHHLQIASYAFETAAKIVSQMPSLRHRTKRL